ncbi:hypothetical protein A0J61_09878 [Choanephora cucurbitarum]|uniref:Uncharacterized protein n=1 Tax=Choanephora cucurbitarum TaxID=101091 RepID=A0A1C7MZ87_9FUNG|nr:hypothetical protein A0J61_09878 [Choanephora cucurbitarum]
MQVDENPSAAEPAAASAESRLDFVEVARRELDELTIEKRYELFRALTAIVTDGMSIPAEALARQIRRIINALPIVRGILAPAQHARRRLTLLSLTAEQRKRVLNHTFTLGDQTLVFRDLHDSQRILEVR